MYRDGFANQLWPCSFLGPRTHCPFFFFFFLWSLVQVSRSQLCHLHGLRWQQTSPVQGEFYWAATEAEQLQWPRYRNRSIDVSRARRRGSTWTHICLRPCCTTVLSRHQPEAASSCSAGVVLMCTCQLRFGVGNGRDGATSEWPPVCSLPPLSTAAESREVTN